MCGQFLSIISHAWGAQNIYDKLWYRATKFMQFPLTQDKEPITPVVVFLIGTNLGYMHTYIQAGANLHHTHHYFW